ncbi:MAG: CDP-glucose 4,6-dehydratase, partial [Endomicrobiia bacterium]|nr:CDP-glucose 4,6-dehydratase [Endomicrobiia bacterium]
ASFWEGAKWSRGRERTSGKKESSLLKLSCDKALNLLGWRAAMPFGETVALTSEWYKTYYAKRGRADMERYAVGQIESYIEKAVERGIPWAAGRAK